jgi:hypothetical protein
VRDDHRYDLQRLRAQLWGETRTGRRYHPFAMTPEMVCLDDVVHSLSHTCRFNGHSRRFYSIAQHSMMVADLVEKELQRPGLRWPALMHDAPEAYAQDMIAPIRRGMPEYNAFYQNVERQVYFALGIHTTKEEQDLIRQADLLALAIEAEDLFSSRGESWDLPFAFDALTSTRFPLDTETSCVEIASKFAQVCERDRPPEVPAPRIPRSLP